MEMGKNKIENRFKASGSIWEKKTRGNTTGTLSYPSRVQSRSSYDLDLKAHKIC
jgi:hypothetical protein